MISAVFAMQGVGILLGAVVSCILVLIFQEGIKNDPVFYLDIVWRMCIGLGAIPGMSQITSQVFIVTNYI